MMGLLCVVPTRFGLARQRLGSGDGQAPGIEAPWGFTDGFMSVYMRGSIAPPE